MVALSIQGKVKVAGLYNDEDSLSSYETNLMNSLGEDYDIEFERGNEKTFDTFRTLEHKNFIMFFTSFKTKIEQSQYRFFVSLSKLFWFCNKVFQVHVVQVSFLYLVTRLNLL